ncbi:hypothetical protein AUJ14_03040 [Candidatus Micrarchaeota archaeon CG1_02_55_22]|nr:MAG: hypothetical protein AUJ14_03040 [Candidatus Micrarchaeota archaeon CG1_02_55_22]
MLVLLASPFIAADPLTDLFNSLFGGGSTPEYECRINVFPTGSAPCDFVGGKSHLCQIYDRYDPTSGIPDFCTGFCLDRSGVKTEYDASCINIEVAKSSKETDALGSTPAIHSVKLSELGKATPTLKATATPASTSTQKAIAPTGKAKNEEDCAYYEKWTGKDCVTRAETECFDYEYWDGGKCEDRCEFDQLWNGNECVAEGDEYGVNAMQPNTNKIIQTPNGKLGVIKHENGAVVYTANGKNYYKTPQEALNPGFFAGIGKSLSDAANAVSNWFAFGGKNLDANEKLKEEVADAMLKEIKESDTEQKIATKAIETGVTTGAKLLVGPAAKGITMPATSIKLLAQRGAQVEFEADIKEYISSRAIQDKASISSNDANIQDYSTEKMFKTRSDMYSAFEVAYQRYLLAKKLTNSD